MGDWAVVEDKPEATTGSDWSVVDQPSTQPEPKPSGIGSSDFMGVAKTALNSGINEMMAPGMKPLATNPIQDISEKIMQSTLEEAKRPFLDASPWKGKVARTAQSIGMDILAGSLIGTGIKTGELSSDFIATKPLSTDKELVSDIIKVSNKLYNKTVELLRPSDIADYMEKEVKHPAVMEMSQIIKKAENPQAAISKINNIVDDLFSRRSSLLSDNNKVVMPTQIKGLESYIETEVAKKTVTPAQADGMRRVLADEGDKIDYTKFDLLSAEQMKEYYQGLAQKVYKAGGMDELTSGAQQAYTILASETKKLIEKEIPEIAKINERYDGLKSGRTMLANLGKKMLSNPNDTLNAVAETIGRPSKKSMLSAAVRQIPVVRDWGTYKNSTGEIEKLNNESNALRALLKTRIKQSMRQP